MRTIDQIWGSLFGEFKPVTFREFVESPKFCGTKEIYPFWMEKISALRDPSELIIDGSLGGGKSTIANFYMLYRLYKLFLIPNLPEYLGIMEESPVYLLYFSTSITQAKRSGFQHLINLVDSCKWFEENFPRDKHIKSEIRFPNNFHIAYASTEGHQLSLNVIGFILDEANFRKGVGLGNESEYEEVTHLYTELLDRQITRFIRPNGSPALAILISSASYQSSFLERRKQIVKGVSTAACITAVSYLIKPQNYSKETFEVFIGTGSMSPKIIESEVQKSILIRQLDMEGLPDMYQEYFIKVPETLRPQFKINLSLALQNHSGVPTQVAGRLIQNMEIVREAYYKPEKKWFAEDFVTLSNKDNYQLIELLNLENIEYPERPHSFFMDLSVTGDSGGFACYRNDSTVDKQMHTHLFTLEVVPPPFPAETMLSKFVKFFEDLSPYVNIAAVGSDQFQSKMVRQEILDLLGLEDTRLSLDSSDQFFLHWIRSLVEKTSNLLYIPKLQREIEEAVHDLKARRVVKAPNSTDDLFQSTVGAYFLSSVYTSRDDLILGSLKRNVVGRHAVNKILNSLGYK